MAGDMSTVINIYNQFYDVHSMPYNSGCYLLAPSSTSAAAGALGRNFGLTVTDGSFIAGDGSNWTVRIKVCCSVASV